jgi:hypothetical protein
MLREQADFLLNILVFYSNAFKWDFRKDSNSVLLFLKAIVKLWKNF